MVNLELHKILIEEAKRRGCDSLSMLNMNINALKEYPSNLFTIESLEAMKRVLEGVKSGLPNYLNGIPNYLNGIRKIK